MTVVDAQLHLWEASRPDRRWPRLPHGTPHLAEPPTVARLLAAMDGAGVHRAVLVPPSWEGDRNDVALAAARAHPGRFAVMGRIPAHDPRWAGVLARWPAVPGLLGVRLTLHVDPWRSWFQQGAIDWLWPAAQRAGLPVAVYAPGLVPQIGRIAARHPGLRLVLDHLALPLGAVDEAAAAHLPPLLTVARHPNVAVKATALPNHSTRPSPDPGLRALLRSVVDAFGPHRVFWGSDLTRLRGSYRECVDLVAGATDELSAAEREWVLGRGISAWLSWP